MEEKKEKRVLTIELDNNVKKVSITGLGDDNRSHQRKVQDPTIKNPLNI